jgi:hypothetical protein
MCLYFLFFQRAACLAAWHPWHAVQTSQPAFRGTTPFQFLIRADYMHSIWHKVPVIQTELYWFCVLLRVQQREMETFTKLIVNKMKDANMFAGQGGPIILAQVKQSRPNVQDIPKIWNDELSNSNVTHPLLRRRSRTNTGTFRVACPTSNPPPSTSTGARRWPTNRTSACRGSCASSPTTSRPMW